MMVLTLERRLRRGLCIFCPRKLDIRADGWGSCPCCRHRYRIEYSWNGRRIHMWEQRPLIGATLCEHRQGRDDAKHHEEVFINAS